jgi:hypothetical protein
MTIAKINGNGKHQWQLQKLMTIAKIKLENNNGTKTKYTQRN